MQPSLRQLQYAVAVADTRNFRRAAELCHVSQPALSTQIRELEERLGVHLFERNRQRVIVTEIGREFILRAREILTAVEELTEAARERAKPLTGVLRMGVIPTIAPYLLPRVLPRVREAYPRLRLLLVEDQTAKLVDRLGRGELDILLLALEADLGDVETIPLFRDPFVVAAPRGHPFLTRKTVREGDLSDQEVLLLDDGHCLRDQALSVCKMGGAKELGDFRASSLNTLTQMVAHGIGLTLLPALALEGEAPPRGPVEIRPFAEPAPYRTVGFAWRKRSPRMDEFQLLAPLFRWDPGTVETPETAA